MEDSIKIMVKCPICDWRILDKITPTSGRISIKCPNCRRIVDIDLSFRTVLQYRVVDYPIVARRNKVG